jgi:hypothetical protein
MFAPARTINPAGVSETDLSICVYRSAALDGLFVRGRFFSAPGTQSMDRAAANTTDSDLEPPKQGLGGSLMVSVVKGAVQAPFSHFFMKLFFAAPASGLPSALTALVAQLSAMHFFMNEVFAAPASGLPSLPIALLSQVSCAKAAPPANAVTNTANMTFLSMLLSLEWLQRSNLIRDVRFEQGADKQVWTVGRLPAWPRFAEPFG